MSIQANELAKRFALLGVAGYIAPRHLQAISETGNVLVAASDPSDSVGVLDKYFFEARYFKEFERFDRHIEKLRRSGQGVDYVSICSPNYLHDAHVRFALRAGAHAICEKPLVINPWNIDPLEALSEEHGKKIYPVLQLREHPSILALREKVQAQPDAHHQVQLRYVTARGPWYQTSWKGSEAHSGGLACNVGIHFFDMLLWIFGAVRDCSVEIRSPERIVGHLELERATVSWFLSVDREDLPLATRHAQKTTFRSMVVDSEELEFSGGFDDLHTRVYRRILLDQSFEVKDTRPAIDLVRRIRECPVT